MTELPDMFEHSFGEPSNRVSSPTERIEKFVANVLWNCMPSFLGWALAAQQRRDVAEKLFKRIR